MCPSPSRCRWWRISPNGQLLIIGQAAVALQWAEQLAGQLQVSVLSSSTAGRAELPRSAVIPCIRARNVKVTGYLGAFESAGSRRTRSISKRARGATHASARVPEHAIDYSYQIDLDKCKSHRSCVKACGDVHAIDFEPRRTRARRTLRSGPGSVRETVDPAAPATAGISGAGPRAARAGRRRARARATDGRVRKAQVFRLPRKICAHGRRHYRLHTMHRHLFDRGDQPGRRSRQSRAAPVHGLRRVRQRMPVGRYDIRLPAGGRYGKPPENAVDDLCASRWQGACVVFHNETDGREAVLHLGRRGKGLPARMLPLATSISRRWVSTPCLGRSPTAPSRPSLSTTGAEAPEYIESLKRRLGYAQQILTALGYGSGHFTIVEVPTSPASRRPSGHCREPPSRRLQLRSTCRTKSARRSISCSTTCKSMRRSPRSKSRCIRRALWRDHRRPAEVHAVHGMRRRLPGKCAARLQGAAATEVHRAQLRAVRVVREDLPGGRDRAGAALALTRQAKAEVVLNEAEVFGCIKCGKPFATRQMIDNMLARWRPIPCSVNRARSRG